MTLDTNKKKRFFQSYKSYTATIGFIFLIILACVLGIVFWFSEKQSSHRYLKTLGSTTMNLLTDTFDQTILYNKDKLLQTLKEDQATLTSIYQSISAEINIDNQSPKNIWDLITQNIQNYPEIKNSFYILFERDTPIFASKNIHQNLISDFSNSLEIKSLLQHSGSIAFKNISIINPIIGKVKLNERFTLITSIWHPKASSTLDKIFNVLHEEIIKSILYANISSNIDIDIVKTSPIAMSLKNVYQFDYSPLNTVLYSTNSKMLNKPFFKKFVTSTKDNIEEIPFLQNGKNYSVRQFRFSIKSYKELNGGVFISAPLNIYGWHMIFRIPSTILLINFIKSNMIIFLSIFVILILFCFIPFFILQNRRTFSLHKLSIEVDHINHDSNLAVSLTNDYSFEILELKNKINHLITLFKNTIVELKNNNVKMHPLLKDFISRARIALDNIGETTKLEQQNKQSMIQILAFIDENYKVTQEFINNANLIAENLSNQIHAMNETQKLIDNLDNNTKQQNSMMQETSNSVLSLDGVNQKSLQANSNLILKVQNIQKHSQDISDIIEIITDIAEQTNLLAMNAAIEAAHAGKYGRGFAIVAEEIRKLAENSSKNAIEVRDTVKKIQDQIGITVEAGEESVKELELVQSMIANTLQLNQNLTKITSSQGTIASSIKNNFQIFSSVYNDITNKIKDQKTNEELMINEIKAWELKIQDVNQSLLKLENTNSKVYSELKTNFHVSNVLQEIIEKDSEILDTFKIEKE